ncbi:glycosyltransferase family 1 protein [Dyadobacter sp. 676]|uniref:Glycosyltransferase family 1 protein n=1 Tax=Dyadobacter sp. 676 TaxID=3088362 RepID=A0AAU8FP68_9BACT
MVETDISTLKVIIPPLLLPAGFLPESGLFRAVLRFNEFLIRTKLKSIFEVHRIRDYIFINSTNYHYPSLTDGLTPALKVYQCPDGPAQSFHRHRTVSEDILVRQSDVVICGDRQSFEEKKKRNASTYLVAGAADLGHSSKALNENLPVYPAIAALKRPVIGYFGAIDRRLDYELLQKVAEANPDKSFAFVGPVSKGAVPGWFFTAGNVHFPGQAGYDDMPAVVKGFDVALVPFRKDVNRDIVPPEMFEYLGAGKSVVATDFNPDLKELTKGTVAFCLNAESFSGAIGTALRADHAGLRKNRLAIAAENSWETRIEAVADIIDYHLEQVIQP